MPPPHSRYRIAALTRMAALLAAVLLCLARCCRIRSPLSLMHKDMPSTLNMRSTTRAQMFFQ